MPLTVKVRAKQYPLWQYAAAAFVSLLGSAFWAWIAHSVLGFALPLVELVFFVFSGLSLLFLLLLYLAYEKQFRDHSSRAVPVVASCFAVFIASATLYFLAKYTAGNGGPTAKMVTLIAFLLAMATGIFLAVFVVKYEIE
ncbi:MAG: hypothetical protein ACM3JB_08355 [Acidobacteriaceae bacterium]|nr:hypothetical protein [Terriglobales bacterium]HKU22579.1 hypothetical protein [Terriglobales bacterium]